MLVAAIEVRLVVRERIDLGFEALRKRELKLERIVGLARI